MQTKPLGKNPSFCLVGSTASDTMTGQYILRLFYVVRNYTRVAEISFLALCFFAFISPFSVLFSFVVYLKSTPFTSYLFLGNVLELIFRCNQRHDFIEKMSDREGLKNSGDKPKIPCSKFVKFTFSEGIQNSNRCLKVGCSNSCATAFFR